MLRTARIVVPGAAHHVTQRGGRRQQTFFENADYARYIDLVGENCRKANVEVLAWCLMPNHVHLILVPQTTDGLVRALSSAHQRYTWVINRRNGWTGYLWQKRFHSTPMDDGHSNNSGHPHLSGHERRWAWLGTVTISVGRCSLQWARERKW